MITLPLVRLRGDTLNVTIQGFIKRFNLQSLPSDFIEWQINERRLLFESLSRQTAPVFLSPHLPTLLTLNRDKNDFPLNAASKGVGLVPNDSVIETLLKQLNLINTEIKGKEFFSSLPRRRQAFELLYGDLSKINHRALGGLEIFETQSFFNIVQDPRISLFFVGGSPLYKSYQINCIAEIIDSTQIFYNFVRAMRNLFEDAAFHFQQPQYPYAIKYHIVEVLDKSLRVRDPR